MQDGLKSNSNAMPDFFIKFDHNHYNTSCIARLEQMQVRSWPNDHN
jgi:hypothetical protein